MSTKLEHALVNIENTILALQQPGRPMPFLKVGVNSNGGWFAQIADPEDPETPYYGQGPYSTAEFAITELSAFIEECLA